MTSVLTVLPIL